MAGPDPIDRRDHAPVGAWMLAGVTAGLVCSLAFIAGRWTTWEPYDPLVGAYDAFVVTAATGLALAALALASRLVGMRLARAGAAGWIVLACAVPWVACLLGSGGGTALKAANGVLWLVVAGVAALRWRPSVGARGLPLVGFALVCALGAAAALLPHRLHPAASLALPVALLLAAAPGLPTCTAAAPRATALALALVAAFAGWTTTHVHPGSGQHVARPAAGARTEGPSLLLIVLDTLRQDHMSLYGYARRTTPHIDAWAQGALVFDRSTSASSWTYPSHASLFTGLSPRTHGAHGIRGDQPTLNVNPLSHGFTTLAEAAAASGLATGALVANFGYLGHRLQLDQGFQTYWLARPRTGMPFPPSDALYARLQPWRRAEYDWLYYRDHLMTDAAIDWLRALGGRPSFLFVNYMDVHDPSARPPTAEIPQEDETPWPEHAYRTWDYLTGDLALTESVLRDRINSYDRELAHLDGELARLFAFLEESGLAEQTYVVLTSDHGEYFHEHDLLKHGLDLHEEVIRVPMIVKGPGVVPGRSPKRVHATDVFPSAVAWLGLAYDEATQGPLQGTVMTGAAEGPSVSEWYPSQRKKALDPRLGGRFDRTVRSIRDERYKVLVDDRGGVRLYDLERDPREAEDLAAVQVGAARVLEQRLAEWMAATPEFEAEQAVHGSEAGDATGGALSEDELEGLRALGYVE